MRRLDNPRTLIIVTGGPGTGKSYAAAKIRESIEGLTILSYDVIKEKNFDLYGFDNEEQKAELNEFGLEEFYLCVKKAMWNSETIMIEYPFYQKHKPKLEALIAEYSYNAVTVYLYADWRTVYDRGAARDQNGARHPGHLTNSYHIETYKESEEFVADASLTYEEFSDQMRKKNYDIRLGHTIPLDVTEFKNIDYDAVVREIFGYASSPGNKSRE